MGKTGGETLGFQLRMLRMLRMIVCSSKDGLFIADGDVFFCCDALPRLPIQKGFKADLSITG